MEMSLFKIENEIKNLLDDLASEGEDVNAVLVKLSDALAEKTDQVVHYRESLKNYQYLLIEKINELKNRSDFIDNKIEKFDEYVLNCMSIREKEEFNGSFCKIKKRKPSQSVEIYDEKLIPIEFIKIPEVKPTIMKAELSKILKQGEIVEGARLVDGKVSLMFTIK
jgi:hypothetical protein